MTLREVKRVLDSMTDAELDNDLIVFIDTHLCEIYPVPEFVAATFELWHDPGRVIGVGKSIEEGDPIVRIKI